MSRIFCNEIVTKDVKLHGYYGGIRLIKATIKRFVEYCQANDIALHGRNFEEKVVNAMKHFAELAAWGREALLNRDTKRLAQLIDENFDTRRGICNLPSWQVQMVEVARQCGASAKFAGSGGAIIGTYQDEKMYGDLSTKLAAIGSCVFKPEIE